MGFILLLIPSLFVLVDFIYLLLKGKRLYGSAFYIVLDFVIMLLLPFLFLIAIDENVNDCCSDSAVFSPDHKLTVYVLISFILLAYFYSRLKNKIQSPIIEVLINSILIIGVIFNAFIIYQINFVSIFANYAIIMILLMELIENQKLFREESESSFQASTNKFEKGAWEILNLSPLIKFPVLLITCLPILFLLSSFLLLFGQKPDSIIRSFTDTYKQGFSQLDYMCDNVECGEHFLCSVAANGHKKIVHPNRYGERRGNKIICNRQLLISNAFEELLQQNLPKSHKIIRHNYNKVGNVIHKHYSIFNNKFVSDIIYVLMKPLEWVFLFTLYLFDQNPENRIAKQYLSQKDRQEIESRL